MPEFTDPFPGVVPRQLTHDELVRAILLNIAAELEAVHLYLAHRDATRDEDARKVLFDVAMEEYVHAGEFASLLYRLDPNAGAKAQEGFGEVAELLGTEAPFTVTGGASTTTDNANASPAPRPPGLTVGSLKAG